MIKFKIKNYTIEYAPENKKNTLWLDDGNWHSQSVIFCENGKWDCDSPERLPKYIKEFLNTVKLF